jgi:FdhE protein
MQRILDPAQIEAFAERSIPRVRLSEPGLFSSRARRLQTLSERHPSLGDYLGLMAEVSEAQQSQFDALSAALKSEEFARNIGRQIELAKAHRMPLLQAAGWPRQSRWRALLSELCASVARLPGFPPGVREVCNRLADSPAAPVEAQADAILAARTEGVDPQAAPFVTAALQVYWSAMAHTLRVGEVTQLDAPTVCPVCGTLPVSSIVRSDQRSPGYRYLQCGLCATEWHMVRITCSHCLANEGIAYHRLAGGSEAIRAESCVKCHTYRKIFYQEKDDEVDAVADDLASLALDLLMTEEGFHRGSGNPLLWQNMEG